MVRQNRSLILRRKLQSVTAQRDSLAKQVAVLSAAVEELSALDDPGEVLARSVRLAANFVSPSPSGGRRAVYFIVEGDKAYIAAEYDESGGHAATPINLADHPALSEVVATYEPVETVFKTPELGATARRAVESTSVTHGAAVPVLIDDALHGVLGVGGRGQKVTDLPRLVDLAQVTALALVNAHKRQQLRETTGQLQTALESRISIEQAKGFLSATRGITTEEAFDRLRTFARSHGTSIHKVALAVVERELLP